MSVILRFFGGMLITFIGGSIVFKTEWILQNFGSIQWADEHLGFEGGSRLFYKLIGVFVCFMGILVAFGLFKGFFVSTAGQFLLPKSALQ